MLAKELLSDTIPSLNQNDTGIKALNYMEVFKISHLPIVNNGELLGVISDNDIYDLNIGTASLKEHNFSFNKPHVYNYQHIYEILEVASKNKLTTVPVLDEQNKFVGIITIHDLVEYLADLTAIKEFGGIIELKMNNHDYVLSQISNIIEGNDAKILSLYVQSIPDSTEIKVTIKVNTKELSPIIQTLERYNYDVNALFSKNEKFTELYNERYDDFINYMNI